MTQLDRCITDSLIALARVQIARHSTRCTIRGDPFESRNYSWDCVKSPCDNALVLVLDSVTRCDQVFASPFEAFLPERSNPDVGQKVGPPLPISPLGEIGEGEPLRNFLATGVHLCVSDSKSE